MNHLRRLKHSRKQNWTIVEDRASICGKHISYQLEKSYLKIPAYYIEISFSGEYKRRFLSNSITEAVIKYDLIKRNLVTPCTIDDILEDF